MFFILDIMQVIFVTVPIVTKEKSIMSEMKWHISSFFLPLRKDGNVCLDSKKRGRTLIKHLCAVFCPAIHKILFLSEEVPLIQL